VTRTAIRDLSRHLERRSAIQVYSCRHPIAELVSSAIAIRRGVRATSDPEIRIGMTTRHPVQRSDLRPLLEKRRAMWRPPGRDIS